MAMMQGATLVPMQVDAAARILRRGGIIAYPTEAVWGLGCDPRNEAAVLRLLDIKQRDMAKGLILIAGDESQLAPFIDMAALTHTQQASVRESWPGPNTWVVPASTDAPCWITGAHERIAVRVSAHPDVIALCKAFGGAIVSTSANLAGMPAVHARDALDPRLLARLDGVLDGETGGREAPSLIRDARSGAVLRG